MLVQLHANVFSGMEANRVAGQVIGEAVKNDKLKIMFLDSPWPMSATKFLNKDEGLALLNPPTKFGPRGNRTAFLAVVVFENLNYDATDLVALESRLRQIFLAYKIVDSLQIPVYFARGSIVATVSLRNQDDAEKLTANAANIVTTLITDLIGATSAAKTSTASTTVGNGTSDSSTGIDTNTFLIIGGSILGSLVLFGLCIGWFLARKRRKRKQELLQPMVMSSSTNPYYVRPSSPDQFDMFGDLLGEYGNRLAGALGGSTGVGGGFDDRSMGFDGLSMGFDGQSMGHQSYLDIANTYKSATPGHFYPAESSLLFNDTGQFFSPPPRPGQAMHATPRQQRGHYRPPQHAWS